jgi:RND family efflux transporter MFP subunit
MNRLVKYAVSALLVIVMASGCSSAPEVDPNADAVNKIPIKLEFMKSDMVDNTYVSIGELVPNNQVDLFVNGSGYIEKIQVKTGDIIEKNDLVMLLDDSEKASATYTSTESKLRTVRDDLKAQLDSVNITLEAQEILYSEGVISKTEFDRTNLQYSSLKIQYNNAVVAYRNELVALNESLEDSVKSRIIYSPISGKVAAVYVKEGQAVANQMAMSIVDNSKLFVKTYISSDLKKLLTVGDMVYIQVNGNDLNTRKGCIDQINDLPDMETKLFEALICIEDFSEFIIGDFAEVEFVIEQYEALMVPTRSIIRSGVNQYIYTYKDDNLEKVMIETGRTKDEWIEIVGYEGESFEVVVKGQNQLASDSEVLIVE